jgi:ribosomal protein S18 acetylase RimI-like enzyme
MATAPLTTQDLYVIPLAAADLAALEVLFDEQCEEWRELLGWDYTGPSRLIRDVARARELSGFVAMYGSLTIGFTYYVFEENRCSIGEIFVSKDWRGIGADRELAAAVLRKLDVTPRIRRVESQSISVGNEEAQTVFAANGFQRFDRCYMMIRNQDYAAESRLGRQDDTPAWAIRPWRDGDFLQAVRVVHRSYENSVDCQINNQYGSEAGCADLVSILTEHIWCGSFLRHVSRVAVDGATGKLAGVLMASRVSPGVGHISQISVQPAFQGRGLGRQMIESALTGFFDLGFTAVSLAVTSANAGALHLYESCGFRTVHSFPVFYQDR